MAFAYRGNVFEAGRGHLPIFAVGPQYPVRIKSSGTRESLEPTTVCLVCESKDYEGERFNMLARGFGSWRH